MIITVKIKDVKGERLNIRFNTAFSNYESMDEYF